MSAEGCYIRPLVSGKEGIVVSAHPLASLAGIKVLASGGNAVDAAVAVASALNAVEPMLSGIGGGGMALFYSASEDKIRALAFGGRAPKAARPELYDKEKQAFGILSPLVPGNAGGWLELLEEYGTMKRREVFRYATIYARSGFPISEFGNKLINRNPLEAWNSTASIYLKNGVAPPRGEILVNRDLAKTYDRIGKEGLDAFYEGEIARRIASFFRANGGILSYEDLSAFPETLRWENPICTSYRERSICTVPPPCSGIQILQTINIMEGFDVPALGHNTAEYIHLLAEAMKLARLDTDKYVADPLFLQVPIGRLGSKEHAAKQRARIDATKVLHGESTRLADTPTNRDLGGTTHLAVVDRERNAVNITQTIWTTGGSRVVVSDTGILMNNGMKWFNPAPSHPNGIAPYKAVECCLAPLMIFRDGRLLATVGTPGSYGILQTSCQVIINMIDFGMDVQNAINAPRFRWADENYDPFPPRVLRVEKRIPETVRNALQQKGHTIEVLDDWTDAVGGVQSILRDTKSGWLIGGADPRRDSYAIGW